MKTVSQFSIRVEVVANCQQNTAYEVARRLRMLADKIEEDGAIGHYLVDADGLIRFERVTGVSV